MNLIEITSEQWLKRLQQIPSSTMTPWPKVANNIFCSLQWSGKDAITKAQRKYFGYEVDGKIVASMEVYYISQTTIRVRGLYCDPSQRRNGYMSSCLELALNQYKGLAQQVITFATKEGLLFYKKAGFQEVPQWMARNVEYYDFYKKKYVQAPDDFISLLHKTL